MKYRDYDQSDEKGEYARVFEEEYELLKTEYFSELAIDNEAYRRYLKSIDVAKAHNGYFSIDKKTNHLKDPKMGARAVDSDDVDAYDLILKDKERLLSFVEPTRFHFLALCASRRLGQPKRFRHVHAKKAQRQFNLTSPRGWSRSSAERRSARRSHGPSCNRA